MDMLFPRSAQELWAMMSARPGGAIMAGGTDLLVRLKRTGQKLPALFCLERMEELQQISESEKELHIGAAVVHQRLLDNATVKNRLKTLWDAIAVLGSPPIRHCGTLGGNLCTASPAGDTLPPLYVLDARVVIWSQTHRGSIHIADFISGPGRTALKDGEIVAGVDIPLPAAGTFSAYYKVGKRKALAIAVASMAVQLETAANSVISRVKLAWGSAGPTVITLPQVEKLLRGRILSEELLLRAGKIVSEGVQPIDDIRGSAQYRRMVAGNLLLRLLYKEGSKLQSNQILPSDSI